MVCDLDTVVQFLFNGLELMDGPLRRIFPAVLFWHLRGVGVFKGGGMVLSAAAASDIANQKISWLLRAWTRANDLWGMHYGLWKKESEMRSLICQGPSWRDYMREILRV